MIGEERAGRIYSCKSRCKAPPPEKNRFNSWWSLQVSQFHQKWFVQIFSGSFKPDGPTRKGSFRFLVELSIRSGPTKISRCGNLVGSLLETLHQNLENRFLIGIFKRVLHIKQNKKVLLPLFPATAGCVIKPSFCIRM